MANHGCSAPEHLSLLSVQILTEVQHSRDETPSDDKLAALEQLLQPLFGLLTQFSHEYIPTSEAPDASKDRKKEVT